MPLIRLQLPNEFGLGDPALYRSADSDDPKAVLDGLAVAGLVGILRQLGDLAEFAADVFRDIVEQVAVTTSRSNKMRIRIQKIDTNLTPIEKAVKAQKSHLHFAYTSGSDWHVKIRTKQKHLNCTDLPKFIADSYEKCNSPPHLFLLDRFDSAGAGACLKRYSDPSYFETVCMSSELIKAEKVRKGKKPRHGKRKGSQNKLGGASDAISIVGHHISDRLQFPSFCSEMTTSRSSMSSKLDHTSQTLSYDSDEYISRSKSSFEPVEDKHGQVSTSATKMNFVENYPSALKEKLQATEDYDLQNRSLHGEGILRRSSSVSWDEKTEIVTPIIQQMDDVLDDWQLASGSMPARNNMTKLDVIPTSIGSSDQDDIVFDIVNIPESFSLAHNFREATSKKENSMDALHPLDSDIEKDIVCQTEREVELQFNNKAEGVETLDGLTHQMSDKEIVHQTKQEIELLCKVQTEGVETIDMLTHQMSDKEIVCQTKQETELQSNAKAEGVEIIDVLTHQMSDKEILCQPNQETELQCNVKAEGVETIDVLTQTSDKDIVCQTKQETELQCNVKAEGVETIDVLTNQTSDKEIVCQIKQETELQCNVKAEGVETVDVLTYQTSDKEIVCQTKQEIELQCNVKDEGVETIDVLAHQRSNLFSDSLNVDSPIFSYSSLDNELSPASCPNMTEEMIHVEVTQPSPLGFNLNNLRVYGESSDFIGPSTTGGFETIADDLPSWSVPSNLKLPKVADSLCESENCHTDVPSVTIWTNGGLLGLKPSKPPVFSESDATKKNHQKPAISFSEEQPVQVEEVIPNCRFREVREQSELASNFSGFSDKFFKNSQWGKASVTFHNASVPSNMEATATALKGDSSHITQETRPGVIASQALHCATKKDKFGLPSPPLEHIRISFPFASETSEMKLEFLSRLPERFQDVHFPTFHLLPEQAASFQANCSDSEDDTFCRSSQYLSDDALSPRSDLSSELWEFRECDGNGDNELYDVFCSAPSVISISSSLEFGDVGDLKLQMPIPYDVDGLNAENELKILESGSSLRSSGCSPLCSSTREKDGTRGSLLEVPLNSDPSYPTTDCTSEMLPPPPLLPLQWKIIKSTFSSEEQSCNPDTGNPQIDSHIHGSDTLELHMADVQQQRDANNKAYMLFDQPQLDDERDVHQIPNGSVVL